ncbi:N-acetylmuramoyl-L-alanine amidase family protein [Paenibacillus sp. L3-i20]|uniref:peptidoglycan recognition protein family protein n=1 Tax=Paenibacillus sp. L3-i20 TaxID=2905833 RepID=UPI001EDCB540|nr:N-acetylmuramoyl-L-alanine amidase [Paenibacillus sp. L3-i20]
MYLVDHIPKSTPHNRRPGLLIEDQWITVHNTANPSSTARNERHWLTSERNDVTASFHIVIDDKEAIECIPLNEVAWHAGDGSGKDSGNRTSIGIEICESGNYDVTLDNAAHLVASMLVERSWSVAQLRRHYDWSGKNCPRLMNDKGDWSGWTAFVASVAAKMDEGEVIEVLKPEDANTIILFLSAAYMSTNVPEARKEFNRLANELRKASGQPPEPN